MTQENETSPTIPKHMWALILIPFIGCLVYLNTLAGDFVYDDRFAIERNKMVTDSPGVSDFFTTDFWGRDISDPKSHKSFRPVTVLTFRLNYLMSELNPGSYHFINILLHGLVCMMVVLLARFVFAQETGNVRLPDKEKLLSEKPEVWTAGLLFALHPIHTEAVANVTGRAELLCAVFFISAFLVYVKYASRSYVGLGVSLLFCILATFSKATGIMSFTLLFWFWELLCFSGHHLLKGAL